ncbi:Mur ligase family protein [Aminivibrio sp.]|jgi:hypothetical protein|uniref:Mur ligase family protein n=1 Tax=Aminivibrio sp. TaxID=1872489 RepID=UPI001A3D3285|nr:Mur ligase family protein [Aminivibrio sp.]MBL3539432.1 hypothetical protein [Aminivibrio sp.]MDK2957998.1 gamma-polyglutamate synthase [Synergistaceae bacterium]
MTFSSAADRVPLRILVTGSRGKSSLVRLLTAALEGAGVHAAGRITGVLPREIFDGKETLILRSGPGSVDEMRWWLRSLPGKTKGAVLENSAVDPELQGLAWHWMKPSCTVLTNVRPDHEEVWGHGEEPAAAALCGGIGGGAVILPRSVASVPAVSRILGMKGCELVPCPDGTGFRETHLSLVSGVCSFLGLDGKKALAAAREVAPDTADFRFFREGKGILASAFSANEPESTESLFQSTGWGRKETAVLYNSRKDRIARLRSFLPWLSGHSWKSVAVTGSRPLFLPPGAAFLPLRDSAELEAFIASEGKVFGCGNVAGVPLEYLLGREERIDGEETTDD